MILFDFIYFSSCADDDETLLNQVDETGLPKIMQGYTFIKITRYPPDLCVQFIMKIPFTAVTASQV